VLLGLAPGSDKGHDPWAGFLGELGGHGRYPSRGSTRLPILYPQGETWILDSPDGV
jgi:hypothetical protein